MEDEPPDPGDKDRKRPCGPTSTRSSNKRRKGGSTSSCDSKEDNYRGESKEEVVHMPLHMSSKKVFKNPAFVTSGYNPRGLEDEVRSPSQPPSKKRRIDDEDVQDDMNDEEFREALLFAPPPPYTYSDAEGDFSGGYGSGGDFDGVATQEEWEDETNEEESGGDYEGVATQEDWGAETNEGLFHPLRRKYLRWKQLKA